MKSTVYILVGKLSELDYKIVICESIHDSQVKAAKAPFISITAGNPEALLKVELFGYELGRFLEQM